MKKIILTGFLMFLAFPAQSQVTNLTVNGLSSNFIVTTGDTVRWEYNLPVGATATGELWYDVNQNGTIEPGTDVARFIFTQTDGDTNGNGGPSDMDGAVDGHVLFFQRLGLAPGMYVFKVTQNNVGMTVAGTVQALSSPAHTISGTVTPPPARSARYINMEVRRSESAGSPNFWDAVTDSTGNYAIQMNADTAGNPWRIRIDNNPYPPNVISPDEISLTITGNHAGNNFVFLQASAQVAGFLRDESSNPLPSRGAQVFRNGGGVNRRANTDATGFFQIGLLSSELTGQTWTLESDCNCNNGVTTTELIAQAQLPVINPGDSLFRQLVVYSANSLIQGQVQIDGAPPGFPVQIVAQNLDTAQAGAQADPSTGNFTLNVTNRIYNYYVSGVNLGPGFNSPSILAHPGQTGVIINITTAGVEERRPGIPSKFSLDQNYPNPFNPSTGIRFALPKAAHVSLKVFNLLGQEVASILDGERIAGSYTVQWKPENLSSGIYFYRLQAEGFVQTKALVFLK